MRKAAALNALPVDSIAEVPVTLYRSRLENAGLLLYVHPCGRASASSMRPPGAKLGAESAIDLLRKTRQLVGLKAGDA